MQRNDHVSPLFAAIINSATPNIAARQPAARVCLDCGHKTRRTAASDCPECGYSKSAPLSSFAKPCRVCGLSDGAHDGREMHRYTA